MADVFQAEQLWASMRVPYVGRMRKYPMLEGDIESADAITVASPAFTRPNALCTVGLGKAVGSPTFTLPNLTKALTGVGKTTSSPVLGTPEATLKMVLTAVSKAVASPAFTAPNALSPVAVGKTVGSPRFAKPVLTVI